MKSISKFAFFYLIIFTSLICSSVQAEVLSAFVIRSDRAVQVTVFRDARQSLNQGYLLIEGTGTEWDGSPTPITINDQGSDKVDYDITWKDHRYTMLAGRSGAYSLSIPKPYREIDGLRPPNKDEQKVDLKRLEELLRK